MTSKKTANVYNVANFQTVKYGIAVCINLWGVVYFNNNVLQSFIIFDMYTKLAAGT